MKYNELYESLMEGLKSGNFIHGSWSDDITLETLKVSKIGNGDGDKPWGGLWMTPKAEWSKYSVGMGRNWVKHWKHLYKVEVDLSKVKVLNSGDDIPKEYRNTYSYKPNWEKFLIDNGYSGFYFSEEGSKDFPTVDLVSLVIYDKDAIKSIKYIGDFEKSLDSRVYKKEEKESKLLTKLGKLGKMVLSDDKGLSDDIDSLSSEIKKETTLKALRELSYKTSDEEETKAIAYLLEIWELI